MADETPQSLDVIVRDWTELGPYSPNLERRRRRANINELINYLQDDAFEIAGCGELKQNQVPSGVRIEKFG
jgi:hypothetical protein